MLRFTRSGREYVFRRGPKHLRPVSNKVILRETKVLHALAGTDVPHPRLIAVCEDTSVLGDAVFYLMEPVDGFNAGSGLPALHAGDAGIRHEMGLSMADAVARLGAVDHLAAAPLHLRAGHDERRVGLVDHICGVVHRVERVGREPADDDDAAIVAGGSEDREFVAQLEGAFRDQEVLLEVVARHGLVQNRGRVFGGVLKEEELPPLLGIVDHAAAGLSHLEAGL